MPRDYLPEEKLKRELLVATTALEITNKHLTSAKAEIARLKEEIVDLDESNKGVYLALDDVPYKGTFGDGVLYMKAEIERLQAHNALLLERFNKINDCTCDICVECECDVLGSVDGSGEYSQQWLSEKLAQARKDALLEAARHFKEGGNSLTHELIAEEIALMATNHSS